MTLDPTLRAQVALAALTATGAPRDGEHRTAWEARVATTAAGFASVLSNDRHAVSRVIDGILGDNAKVFTGSIVGVEIEESSGRALITLHTGTGHDKSGNGNEQVRTEDARWPLGRIMARRAHDLIGREVCVWVEVEKTSGGKSVRVVRHLEDRGEAKER
ncbi:hypothetical protein IC607_02550 [Cellulomonas sp. JH27-2]|uniref:hypothetical protein n=1 Tax=Cellulomonas sp. JH27-2 TaxID=2774139 RepID=UPI00177C2DDD|nr:hypothetical protein [Cellulomonas sp. JH27-2]MBD8057846.1 hypothetical protein [Cellulomonas sp. JH27-2]